MADRKIIPTIVVTLALGAAVLNGAPATAAQPSPPPESGSSDWRSVSVGYRTTCGIRTTGRLYCWGADGLGQLGDGGTNTDQPLPVEVAGNATNWTAVSTNGGHTCGRRATGRLYCWGSDSDGQVGDGGTNTPRTTPTLVAGGITNWSSVSVGATHTCGRRATGQLYCWGSDHSGQLGDGGTDAPRITPRLVVGGITDWTSVSAGDSQTCARRATGHAYCWGYDADGLLGNGGADVNRGSPTLVAGGITNWASISAGDSLTCGRRATGQIYCWGSDSDGQLGNDGASVPRSIPTPVAGGGTWTSVTAGGNHACGRRPSGRLFCWGNDSSGELGDGGASMDRFTPVQVAGGATDWTVVDAGVATLCARITSGRLFCWGSDGAGQVGDGGTNANQGRPAQVFAP
jgi:hypothetical protein